LFFFHTHTMAGEKCKKIEGPQMADSHPNESFTPGKKSTEYPQENLSLSLHLKTFYRMGCQCSNGFLSLQPLCLAFIHLDCVCLVFTHLFSFPSHSAYFTPQKCKFLHPFNVFLQVQYLPPLKACTTSSKTKNVTRKIFIILNQLFRKKLILSMINLDWKFIINI